MAIVWNYFCQYLPHVFRSGSYWAFTHTKRSEMNPTMRQSRKISVLELEAKEKHQPVSINTNDDGNTTKKVPKMINKPRYVRINTIKMKTKDAISYLLDEGWTEKKWNEMSVGNLGSCDFIVDDFVPNLLAFAHKTEFYNHMLYLNGIFILQDKASCLPPLALKPKSRGRGQILDACAAPGMKTSLLSSLCPETEIFAVEKSFQRSITLKSMLKNMGVENVTVLTRDFTDLDPNEYPDVKYILVDPSCSGSGMYGRIEMEDLGKDRLKKLSYCQMKLLLHAMKFPSVKRIVYSTCSLNPMENEDVVAAALDQHDVNLYKRFIIKTALPNWPNRVQNDAYSWSNMCAKSDYENNQTDGFFIALLESKKYL